MKKGLLIVLSGPSGVGKKTIWTPLMNDSQFKLAFSISMTTRSPREGEVDGKDYFFVTKQEFEQAIKENKMLEYATYVNNYYGTPKAYVEKLRNEGKNVLLEIEVQGALKIIDMFKNDDGLVSIFILPPSESVLIERLRGRDTETKEIIDGRIKQAQWELSKSHFYQHQIINDNIDQARNQLKSILITAIKNNEK
ncbi:MAG: guanylate kinase [Mycoplasmataceae bacterium]|nr:guanylate kinase [Mycoplasmataceae bacterium]